MVAGLPLGFSVSMAALRAGKGRTTAVIALLLTLLAPIWLIAWTAFGGQ